MGVLTTTWEQVCALARRGTPVFALELRVHSRQRRTFAFRAVYVGLLLLYVALLWQGVVSQARAESGQAWSQSIMADVGQRVTQNVLIFQFLAGQAAAVILMCGAFSDEFARGRLPALLTTPLTDTQVVAGKFLSRLVQLLVLMLATLPVLAVVRLFGGVPWMFLLGGTGLSLTAAMFTGSVTLLNALRHPQPHAAALRSIGWGVCVFVVAWFAGFSQPMTLPTAVLMAVVSVAGLAAAVVVVIYVCRVEFSKAVRRAVGDGRTGPSLMDLRQYMDRVYLPVVPGEEDITSSHGISHVGYFREEGDSSPVGRAQNYPPFWKAMRQLGRSTGFRPLLLAVVCIYVAVFLTVNTASPGFHLFVLGALLSVVAIWCGFQAACVIAMDKESGFWPLVLSTPMDSWTIFAQRARVIFRRSWMLLAAAGAHVAGFAVAGVLHPAAVVQLPIVLAWAALFVVAVGVYCSARGRTTTGAVLATFTTLSVLWLGAPLLAVLLGNLVEPGGWWYGATLWLSAASPFTHLRAGLSGCVEHAGPFAPMTWCDGSETLMPAGRFLLLTTFWTTAYAVASVWLIHTTVRSFRRRVYE